MAASVVVTTESAKMSFSTESHIRTALGLTGDVPVPDHVKQNYAVLAPVLEKLGVPINPSTLAVICAFKLTPASAAKPEPDRPVDWAGVERGEPVVVRYQRASYGGQFQSVGPTEGFITVKLDADPKGLTVREVEASAVKLAK